MSRQRWSSRSDLLWRTERKQVTDLTKISLYVCRYNSYQGVEKTLFIAYTLRKLVSIAAFDVCFKLHTLNLFQSLSTFIPRHANCNFILRDCEIVLMRPHSEWWIYVRVESYCSLIQQYSDSKSILRFWSKIYLNGWSPFW